MADIDQIIAGGSGAGSRYDFSTFDPVKAFFDANKQRAEFDTRRAFKDGVPTTADGQPDFGAMSKTLMQKGDIAGGVSLIAPAAREKEMGLLTGGPQQSSIVSPPSANRSATATVAPPLNKGGTTPQGDTQGGPQGGTTLMQVLSAQGIPNDQLGAASASIARQLGLSDPNAPVNLQDPQVRNVLVPAVQQLKRQGLGQVQTPQPGDNPPQRIAQPIGVAPQNDSELKKWTFLAASPDKQIAAAAKVRLEALQQDRKLTDDQKNAAAAGVSLTDYQNRADENTTQRDILTKSLLPRVDASQEKAFAARDDVDAIHRARGELDQKGGVFSGSFADKKLYLAKAAELLGVPNAGSIQNTEAYGSAIGQRVAVMVKAFGSGTAISDGDRKFAAAMAGGQVTLDENSMRRILDIGEKAARSKIDYHNQFVDKVTASNEGLKPARDSFLVQAPGQYKKPEIASASPNSAASVSSKADYDKLPKGAKFTGPDGKSWQKP